MSASQRAAVAVTLLPHITETVSQSRAEKVRAAWQRKREQGCQSFLTDNLADAGETVTSRAIAAQMMRASDGYVKDALRVQQDAPELFEQLHAGKVTLQEALRTLDGTTTDARTQQVKAARTRLNRLLRELETHPDSLARLETFLDQSAGAAEVELRAPRN